MKTPPEVIDNEDTLNAVSESCKENRVNLGEQLHALGWSQDEAHAASRWPAYPALQALANERRAAGLDVATGKPIEAAPPPEPPPGQSPVQAKDARADDAVILLPPRPRTHADRADAGEPLPPAFIV